MTEEKRMAYLSMKLANMDSIIFVKLGDFYEVYGNDAAVVARILESVVTSRQIEGGDRIPMTGVPYHSIDAAIGKLEAAGYGVIHATL